MIVASTEDFRRLARRRLPRFLFDYIDGGSYAETTLRRNVEDLQSLTVRQRVMRDISKINLATELFGRSLAMPVALAPVGSSGFFARRGEVQAVRAAQAAGVPMILSTVSGCSLEEVSAAAAAPIWFQLYIIRDRAFMRDLLARAAALGIDTLFLTVDLPVAGARYRDVRSGLAGGQGAAADLGRLMQILASPRWAWDVGVRGRPLSFGNVARAMPPGASFFQFFAWLAANFDPTVTWADIAWVKQSWSGRVIVKGVLDPEDARLAFEAGADGLVVSNHGGRQLDGAPSSISALPPIVEAIEGRIPVLMDGGVRSGLDVLRALALGADGVLIGRAWAYALAAQGGAGVARVLEIIRQEMLVAMALLGKTDVRDVDRSCLAAPPPLDHFIA